MPQPSSLIQTIRDQAALIRREKQAADVGETTHPVGDADNGTVAPNKGPRYKENTEAAQEISPNMDDNAPSTSLTDTGGDRLPVGTNASATGEDPDVEDNYSDGLKDPGTASPANLDNGEKYASMSYEAVCREANDLASRLLADAIIDNRQKGQLRKSATATAAAAGYTDATLAEKRARDEAAAMAIYDAVNEGREMAERAAAYLLIKRAEELDEEQQQQLLAALAEQAGQADGGGGPDHGDEHMMGHDEIPADAGDIDAATDAGVSGAIDDLGLSPEEQAQIIQLLAAQEQGAVDDHGEEAIPGLPPKEAGTIKMAIVNSVHNRRRGRYASHGQPKTAFERSIRENMRGFLSEICGR